MIGFFPYYIFGMAVKHRGFTGGLKGGWLHQVMSHPWSWYAALCNVFVTVALAFYATNCHPYDWVCTEKGLWNIEEVEMVYPAKSHDRQADLSGATPNIWACILATLGRCFIYAGSSAQIILTMCLLPNTEVIWNLGFMQFNVSKRGQRSLINYIFHVSVVILLLLLGWFDCSNCANALHMFGTVFFMLITVQFLLSDVGYKIFNPLTAPPMKWMFEDV